MHMQVELPHLSSLHHFADRNAPCSHERQTTSSRRMLRGIPATAEITRCAEHEAVSAVFEGDE